MVEVPPRLLEVLESAALLVVAADVLDGVPEAEPESPRVEAVDHPGHYGGAENTYEIIKVIDAWGLGFSLGNAVKQTSKSSPGH